MIAIECISAACVVVIKFAATPLSCQVVVGGVVNSLEAEGWALVVALVCVVVNNVENDFDACFVQGFHHVSKFIDVLTGVWVDAIALMWGKVSHRAVAPVVHQWSAVVHFGDIGIIKAADWE